MAKKINNQEDIKEFVEKRLSLIKKLEGLETEKATVAAEIKSIKSEMDNLDQIMRDAIAELDKN